MTSALKRNSASKHNNNPIALFTHLDSVKPKLLKDLSDVFEEAKTIPAPSVKPAYQPPPE